MAGALTHGKVAEMTIGRLRVAQSARSLVRGLVLTVTLSTVAAVAIPVAHADAVDNAFLNALQAKGINFSTPQAAVVAGHEVCDELLQGTKQKADVVSTVMANSQMDGYHAGFFVGLSEAAYCPQFKGSQ
jgi:hypothetical protein